MLEYNLFKGVILMFKKIIYILAFVMVICINRSSIDVFDDVVYVSDYTMGDYINELVITPVLATYYGSMTGYGPDCSGCYSNLTASGFYVGDGNIYYDDSQYGLVRIVAADSSFPFGTIVRISNVSLFESSFYAIVLDRGSAIGFNRHALFDLLFASEKETSQIGKANNVRFEVLRYGY